MLGFFRQTLGKMARAQRLRASAFTLPELLTVIAIVALLMTASVGSLNRARALAKRTKAEVQLRELVNAWKQYYTTYGEWPASISQGRFTPATAQLLAPITNPENSDNKDGIVFFNYSGSGDMVDPWNTPFRLSFGTVDSDGDRFLTTFETTVALPRRELPKE